MLSGTADELVINDRVDGITIRYPVLQTDRGEVLLLQNADVKALPAGARATIVARAAERDASAAVVESITSVTKDRAAASVAPLMFHSGDLRLAHADNFDGAPSEFFYSVVGDTGRQTRLKLSPTLEGVTSGMRVNVTGRTAADGTLVPTQIDVLDHPTPHFAYAATAKAVTVNQTLVIPIKFTSSGGGFPADPFPISQIQSAMFGATNSAAAYYQEVSYGKQALSGTVASAGSGWVTTATVAPTNCDITVIANAAGAAATALGYNLNAYQNIVYIFGSQVTGCGWSGLGYVGWGRAYINNTTNLLVIGHELGHNFGLLHAASLDCGAWTITSNCSSSEYGDPFVIMGNQRAMHFNAAQKSLLGWIAPATVKTHLAGVASYTIAPLESAGGSTYAVQIKTSGNRTYWLEYRQPIGFDSGISAFPNNGVQLRVANPFESLCSGCADDTEFLDATPATSAFTDGTLLVGQTYNDFKSGLAITVTSANAAGVTVSVSGPRRWQDLGADAKTDLLWRNNATGGNGVWLMNGTTASLATGLMTDMNWKVTQVADFNGDGKADLIWYNASTGGTGMWLMNGASATATTGLLTDPNWKVAFTGDFNGDGKADLLWYNAAAGQTGLWLMNGTSAIATTGLMSDPNWKPIGVGDFNGDGRSDILWYNASTGATTVWLMNGTTALSYGTLLVDPNWKVSLLGDFNGDGQTDIVWYNAATGSTAVWLMNGATPLANAGLLTDPNWKVAFVGDFNGDGKSDLIWYNAATGGTGIWLMNGTSVVSATGLMTSLAWKVVAVGDFNGDGKSDLVWNNASTGGTGVWLMNGATTLSTAGLLTDPNWKIANPQ